MSTRKNNLSPQRLVEASEAALLAAAEAPINERGVQPHVLEVLGTPNQPDCLSCFTRDEIEQACAFLTRLGFMPALAPRRAA
jgi:hypothetical protein